MLAHGRALLAGDGTTTVINADMRDPDAILSHPDTERLIDFSEPLAVLYLSIGHHLFDADDPRQVVHGVFDRAISGSHLVFTQITSDDPERRAAMDAAANGAGMPWRTRSRAEVDALLTGPTPVEPGLVDIGRWRPDPASRRWPPSPPSWPSSSAPPRATRTSASTAASWSSEAGGARGGVQGAEPSRVPRRRRPR